ncbi:MAG TPA: CHAT domain-containing protein [Thermoanaerobaculia bacterium]|nr:CHAT domain-containing protein [Thermoanaerobaculia bacterium]
MEYQDFLIQLHTAGEGRFRVSASSPAGQDDGEFPASALPAEWSRGSRDCIVRELDSTTALGRSGLSAAEIGARLYQVLFPEDVRSLFERSLDLARADRAGLRIKIFLSPRDPAVRLLQSFPWELLRHGSGRFLALSRWTPIIRSLPVAEPPKAPSFPDQVRVLAALASPQNTAALDLHRELSEMRSAEGLGSFKIVSRKARLTELRPTLERNAPVHVLHFLGHGDFLEDSGDGVLVFENSDGTRETVTGSHLAETLRDVHGLQLVVLNACKTARSSLGPLGNPFGGVAAALVQAGFPAVLAMQEVIADSDAIALSSSLYGHLALERPLEGALTEARQAVYNSSPRSFAWATPSLFLRASPPPSRENESQAQVKEGIGLFRAGRFTLARQRLQEVLARNPRHDRAHLFENLSRMAMGDLSGMAIGEIDDALQELRASDDPKVGRLASLALGILRLDILEPRGIRIAGIHSFRLFRELERFCWTPEEKEIVQALRPSQSARDLLNLHG